MFDQLDREVANDRNSELTQRERITRNLLIVLVERYVDADPATVCFDCAGPFAGYVCGNQNVDCGDWDQQKESEHLRGLRFESYRNRSRN